MVVGAPENFQGYVQLSASHTQFRGWQTPEAGLRIFLGSAFY